MNERHTEIIKAAGTLISEEGFGAMTTKNLAARIGFSEPALYRYFQSKEEIIVEMIRSVRTDLEAALKEIDSAGDGSLSPMKQVQAVFDFQSRYFHDNRHFIPAVLSETLIGESPQADREITALMDTRRRFLEAKFRKARAELSESITPADAAHLVMGAFRLLMLQWKMENFSFDFRRKSRRLMQSIYTLLTTKN